MSWLDLPLWFTILGMEIVLAGLVIRGRVYKLLPIFSLYVAWVIVSDVGMMAVQRFFADIYNRVLVYEISLDALLQFGVLVELAWSILRPIRSSLPRWTVLAISLLILAVGAALWPISGFTVMRNLTPEFHVLLRLLATFAIVRILFFVVLAAGSQMLSISWRDRELQIATGLGFYSLGSLVTSLLHAQMPQVAHYHTVDQLMSASYLVSLVYWSVCMWQKEAPRQEFSPQMQSFLLTVSGTARAGRVALQDGNRRR